MGLRDILFTIFFLGLGALLIIGGYHGDLGNSLSAAISKLIDIRTF